MEADRKVLVQIHSWEEETKYQYGDSSIGHFTLRHKLNRGPFTWKLVLSQCCWCMVATQVKSSDWCVVICNGLKVISFLFIILHSWEYGRWPHRSRLQMRSSDWGPLPNWCTLPGALGIPNSPSDYDAMVLIIITEPRLKTLFNKLPTSYQYNIIF